MSEYTTDIAKITSFLEKFDIFQDIAEFDPPLPTMDISMDWINEADYYGVNFSTHPVLQLFFCGASNYFPAIVPIGSTPLEKCPIFIFDLQDNDEPTRYIGNFKTYITQLFTHYIHVNPSEAKLTLQALDYLNHNFSSQCQYFSNQIIYPIIDGGVSIILTDPTICQSINPKI